MISNHRPQVQKERRMWRCSQITFFSCWPVYSEHGQLRFCPVHQHLWCTKRNKSWSGICLQRKNTKGLANTKDFANLNVLWKASLFETIHTPATVRSVGWVRIIPAFGGIGLLTFRVQMDGQQTVECEFGTISWIQKRKYGFLCQKTTVPYGGNLVEICLRVESGCWCPISLAQPDSLCSSLSFCSFFQCIF